MVKNLILYLGIALTIIGIGLIVLSILPKAEVKGGGVILIGPFPIVFGTDQQMAFLAIAMAIALIVALLVLHIAKFI